jgi:hypothetical protein
MDYGCFAKNFMVLVRQLLLFIPAGAGIMVSGGRIRRDALEHLNR